MSVHISQDMSLAQPAKNSNQHADKTPHNGVLLKNHDYRGSTNDEYTEQPHNSTTSNWKRSTVADKWDVDTGSNIISTDEEDRQLPNASICVVHDSSQMPGGLDNHIRAGEGGNKVDGGCLQSLQDKNEGARQEDIERNSKLYPPLDRRFLEQYPGTDCVRPMPSAQEACQEGGKWKEMLLSLDFEKLHAFEELCQEKGLITLGEYPMTPCLREHLDATAEILYPICCLCWYLGRDPQMFLETRRVLRWSLVYISTNGHLYEFCELDMAVDHGLWQNVDLAELAEQLAYFHVEDYYHEDIGRAYLWGEKQQRLKRVIHEGNCT